MKPKGFTLIELLIALLLSGIVVSAIYSLYISQNKSYTIQEQITEMQQNARVAMDIMVRNIRMAGYDPTGAGNFGFQATASNGRSTDANSTAFTVDDDGDGTLDSNDHEQVGFRLNGLDLQKYSTGAVHWQPLAENIESLDFVYTLEDGSTTTTPADPSQIREVQITLTARTEKPDPDYSLNGGYRQRTLTTMVVLRNLQ